MSINDLISTQALSFILKGKINHIYVDVQLVLMVNLSVAFASFSMCQSSHTQCILEHVGTASMAL